MIWNPSPRHTPKTSSKTNTLHSIHQQPHSHITTDTVPAAPGHIDCFQNYPSHQHHHAAISIPTSKLPMHNSSNHTQLILMCTSYQPYLAVQPTNLSVPSWATPTQYYTDYHWIYHWWHQPTSLLQTSSHLDWCKNFSPTPLSLR